MPRNPIGPMMTVAEVEGRLDTIREVVKDPHRARGREHDLWFDVLQAIANGDCREEVAEIAGMALESSRIKFPRWSIGEP